MLYLGILFLNSVSITVKGYEETSNMPSVGVFCLVGFFCFFGWLFVLKQSGSHTELHAFDVTGQNWMGDPEASLEMFVSSIGVMI